MSGSKLDQIVKGAPPPGTSIPAVVSRSPSPVAGTEEAISSVATSASPMLPSDPLATLPSSPPQIYLNLLILEASLRSQFILLRTRRRQNTFFIFLLSTWIAIFTYLLFLRPREDGSGVGGSVYWVVETAEKVALMGGLITGLLIWGTGQWERGVRWPRRWLAVANRGLRTMNAKLVVVKGPWWKEMLGNLSFLFPYPSLLPLAGPFYPYHNPDSEKYRPQDEEDLSYEEDLSPGGDYVKLLLLPKPFSSDFRENWELYRLEYWEKENERRACLREALHKYQKDSAREQSGWLWWFGLRRWRLSITENRSELEKSYLKHPTENEGKRRHSFARSESHSRTASRSSTPSTVDPEEKSTAGKSRRGSTTASASERRRKAKPPTSIDENSISKLTPISRPT